MSDPCTLLAWDSRHWGFPIARINAHRLTDDSARQAFRWCEERKVRCLYFAADGACAQTLEAAGRNGFRFIDVRIDMEQTSRESLSGTVDGCCRAAGSDDLPALEKLARAAHGDTRFFKDTNFDPVKAADLYAIWIARDLRDHRVFVAEPSGESKRILGYVSASEDDGKKGRIGLIAVDPTARSHGIGRLLVQNALASFRSRSVASVKVATQGTNVAALRLYESCGFKVADVKVWFHRWFDK